MICQHKESQFYIRKKKNQVISIFKKTPFMRQLWDYRHCLSSGFQADTKHYFMKICVVSLNTKFSTQSLCVLQEKNPSGFKRSKFRTLNQWNISVLQFDLPLFSKDATLQKFTRRSKWYLKPWTYLKVSPGTGQTGACRYWSEMLPYCDVNKTKDASRKSHSNYRKR